MGIDHKPGNQTVPRSAFFGAFYVVLGILVAPVLIREIVANDVWKALYTGRYLAYFHQAPNHSAFTFAPVVEYSARNAFNWLGNLVFYGTWFHGGMIGVHGLRLFVGVAVILTLHSVADYDPNPFTLLLLVLVSYGVYQKLLLRTAIFGLPGVTLLYWIWDRVYDRGRTNWLYALPPLFLIWSNLHGSFVVGLVLLGTLTVGTTMNGCFRDARQDLVELLPKLCGVLVLSILATTYVHPFPVYTFFELSGRVLETFGTLLGTAIDTGAPHPIVRASGLPYGSLPGGTANMFSDVTATLEPVFNQLIGERDELIAREFGFTLNHLSVLYVRVGLLLLVLGAATFLATRDRTRYDLLLVYLASGYLGIAYVRGVAYVAVASVFVVLVHRRHGTLTPDLQSPPAQFVGVILVGLLMGPIGLSLTRGKIPSFLGTQTSRIGFGQAPRFATELPERVRDETPEKRYFNTFNMGANLIWKWWPYRRVLIDSKTSAYRDFFVDQYTQGKAIDLVRDYQLTAALVPRPSAWNRDFFAPNPDWNVRVSDDYLLVYERTGKSKP